MTMTSLGVVLGGSTGEGYRMFAWGDAGHQLVMVGRDA